MNFELTIEPHYTFFVDSKMFAWLKEAELVLTVEGILYTWQEFVYSHDVDATYQDYLEHVYGIENV